MQTEYQADQQSTQSLLTSLNSDLECGLSFTAAAQRLKLEGPNEPSQSQTINAWAILIDQFKSSVVILLIVATFISLLMHEYLQASGIIAVLIANAAIGFFTEYRAKISLKSLSRIAGSTIRVRRARGEIQLPVRELVRGDIVLLEAGVRVPADLCILESASFSLDESPLTGESVPVWKTSSAGDFVGHDTSIAFQGTGVLSGRATCVVVATGAKTRIGQLGHLLQNTISGETPLTRSLDTLGHQLTLLVLALCAAFAVLGLLRHEPLERMLETSIALAVAAIPDGLPVTATLALAAGVARMVRAKALVRRLPAVETLGRTTLICTDKTGTLTENKMLVTDIVLHDEHVQLTGHGYEPIGQASSNGLPFPPGDQRLHEFLTAICLCNDARLEIHDKSEGWHIHGDPTEGSLITAAVKLGENSEALRSELPRLAEIPFDLGRKRMSTIHRKHPNGCLVFCKGSPETVLPLCTHVRGVNGDVELSDEIRQWFITQNNNLAGHGLRVLAVACRDIEKVPDNLDATLVEAQLHLLGLVAMSDRPKENVEAAIKMCQSAGIRIVMLTGDQRATALAVARELGIVSENATIDAVLTGEQLHQLSPVELKAALNKTSVLARVTPEMKLDIVKSFQNSGHIVAMTGDGINDAPALQQSNIGIAMGLSGTDMAREASDLVITDDNFATIVKAIEQGRITYTNISRAIGYLLTASFTSVIAITFGLLANTGLFLQPLQLLFLNLIMHVLPSLGIVLQKGATGIMKHGPKGTTEKFLNSFEQVQIATRSILVAIVSLVAISIDQCYLGTESATTVALATLSLSLILQAWSWLSVGGQTPATPWYANIPMLVCTALNLLLLGLAIYLPALQTILNTTALNEQHIAMVVVAAVASYLISLPLNRLGTTLPGGIKARLLPHHE